MWEVIYWTEDWTDTELTCDDDIIVCNWTTWSWATIAACNLWTSVVWTGITSYWWLYQWWNNFDFREGQFTDWGLYSTISTTQVSSITDYSTYSDWTFIMTSSDWTSLDSNWLLRSTNWNPCPTWYYIPTELEWEELVELKWDYLWVNLWTSMVNDLKMPLSWRREWSNATLSFQDFIGRYWSSSPDTTNAHYMNLYPTSINPNNYDYRSNAFSVRCFKN